MSKTIKSAIGVQFEAHVRGHMVLAGYKQKELAKVLKMTPETLRKRTRSPWLFTVEDIRKMAETIAMPPENLFALAIGKKCPADSESSL